MGLKLNKHDGLQASARSKLGNQRSSKIENLAPFHNEVETQQTDYTKH